MKVPTSKKRAVTIQAVQTADKEAPLSTPSNGRTTTAMQASCRSPPRGLWSNSTCRVCRRKEARDRMTMRGQGLELGRLTKLSLKGGAR